jgi:AP-3 complex subunit mu
LLHIDAYQQALASAPDNQPDPVILVASHNGPAACCHVSQGDLTFLCPVRGDDDPVFAFAFLQTLLDVLIEYLGDLSSHTLREHLDVVYQLMEEILDDGRPLTTELNALRDIVMPPSFLKKIISISGMPGLSKTSSNPFTSPIPWRKTGVRYSANEIYFDLSEQMDAVVSR